MVSGGVRQLRQGTCTLASLMQSFRFLSVSPTVPHGMRGHSPSASPRYLFAETVQMKEEHGKRARSLFL